MATIYNIEISKQEALLMSIDVSMQNNITMLPEPIDLSQYTFYFTVKKEFDKSPHNRDALIKLEWTNQDMPEQVSELEVGKTILKVSSLQTNIPVGKYKYDIVMKDINGDIKPLFEGKFIIKQNVTVI